MDQDTTYIGLDVSKKTIAVGIAEGGSRGEVRFYGSISSAPDAVAKLVRTLATRHEGLAFAYEAGPTGYGLHRQLTQLGYPCQVVAPSMTPARPGSQVKTDRRDAVVLASLFRAGELTPIWVPDTEHEAMRDLIRARLAAVGEIRRTRQQLLSFVLRHGRTYAVPTGPMAGTGPKPIAAGSAISASIIRRSRSRSRNTIARSSRRKIDASGSSTRSKPCCRNGRCAAPWRRSRRCVGYRSSRR